jgi:hypothetical protein
MRLCDFGSRVCRRIGIGAAGRASYRQRWMVLTRRFQPPDLVTATLDGVVTADDQVELVSFVRAAIAIAGSVRVLLHVDRFGGWKPDARLDPDSVWLHDDEGVSRIGIFGDLEWKATVLTVMAQPLRRVPIAYFATEAAARRWLQQPSRASVHHAYP